jgi:hypothetical protein
MPFSFHGFGPTAIFVMVLCLAVNQFYLYLKQRQPKKF